MENQILNPTTIEWVRLAAVARLLEVISHDKIKCKVEDVYFDMGQNWCWTTIVAYRGKDSWQMLYTDVWQSIIECEDAVELFDHAMHIYNEQKDLIER